MSIASEITRLQTAKANIKTSIENKGVVVSSSDKLDDYSSLIDSINISTQVKTVNPQNYTREITPDVGYRGLSKVVLDGVLVDAHDSYTSTTDDDVAYEKIVPSGALKYASLDKLGGMSYKCNNLANNPTITNSVSSDYNPIIALENLNLPAGTYTISFTNNNTLQSGTRYYVTAVPSISYIYIGANSTKTSYSLTFTTTETTTKLYVRLQYTSGGDTGTTSNVMLNVGSTALLYESYFEGIRDSAITSVVSKDSNNITIDTLTIDSNIQALNGYGWGANNSSNTIDFNAKTFTKNTNKYTFSNNPEVYTRSVSGTLNGYQVVVNNSNWKNGTLNSIGDFDVVVGDSYTSEKYSLAKNRFNISFNNSRGIDTVEKAKQYIAGKTIVYELATPVETDISQYIDNNTIEVEESGTLVSNNTYEQKVPSEITYLVEV